MKDVKYKDSDWQSLSEGIIQLTGSGLFEWITEADKISDEATDSCDTYDVDCAITIDTAGNATYDELENRFTLLQQAIQHIPDTLSADVDYPFYNELDGVLEKMSNMNIMGYETMARGSFSNGVNSAGVPTQKMKVTLDDILGSSSPLSDYLRVEYNEKKKQLGDVSYEDYQKMAFADTSFDYYSKGEKIKDLGVTLLVNGALIAVGAMLPWPIMVALGFASAGKNGYDAVTGKDLFTGKELTTGDRILRGLSGVADLALAIYGTYKGVQAIKGTNKVVSAYNKKNIDIDDVVDANDIIKNSKNGKNYALDKNKSAGNKTYKNGSGSKGITPSSVKGGKPKGKYSSPNSRGLIRENETADLFASKGYKVEMLEEIDGGNGYGITSSSNPDYLIEDIVFDCYSPDVDTKIKGITRQINEKTKKQTTNIVVNLDDYGGDINVLKDSLLSNTSNDLKYLTELYFVKNNEIFHIFRR
ncbi:pre-toxin TG domain-containing protein [uncultured Enterococcus sp.]|uniref:CdiA C-terminal domain-containing protein n=1 Tax=uncultured Enterococcus sp. TaxID=167972 RepID=UPI002AA77C5F|nr:pre-toxin TG domain-containing protein [uncultured Enterococcus sp.]